MFKRNIIHKIIHFFLLLNIITILISPNSIISHTFIQPLNMIINDNTYSFYHSSYNKPKTSIYVHIIYYSPSN